MSQEELALYNAWFAEIEWVNIENSLSLDEDLNLYEGTFVVPIRNKDDLIFEMRLGKNYPNNNIKFYCLNEEGYDHQMPDGEICHNPEIYLDKKTKFTHEFKQLNSWIKKFYINEEESDHYEHLLFSNTIDKKLLFTDLDLKYLQENEVGYFNFIQLNELRNKRGDIVRTFLVIDMGDIRSTITSSFKELLGIKDFHLDQGIWMHLNKPPVLYRRKTISKWDDLLKVLSNKQIKHLYNYKDYVHKQKGIEAKFFLLVSYPIYNTEKEVVEAHIELIEDHVKEGPKETKYKNLESFNKIEREDSIIWGKTKNISYENFFGRGTLANQLIGKKILLIGIGAIGSSLAKILVRGGVTFLGLIDFDTVESGNICRSEYRPYSIQEHKISALEKELVSISPFVQVNWLFRSYSATHFGPYSATFHERC